VTLLHSQTEKSNSINILRQHNSKVKASPVKIIWFKFIYLKIQHYRMLIVQLYFSAEH